VQCFGWASLWLDYLASLFRLGFKQNVGPNIVFVLSSHRVKFGLARILGVHAFLSDCTYELTEVWTQRMCE
jgi:hypothetical protein